MEEWSIVATNQEHLIMTRSPGILLLLWGYTEMFPLLYFCTIPPPRTQEQTHTSLFLYSFPSIMCRERGSRARWAFALTSCGCSVLCHTLMLQPGRPRPRHSLSLQPALQAGSLMQSLVNSVKSFFSSSEQTPKGKSLVNTPAENIWLLHGAGQEQ